MKNKLKAVKSTYDLIKEVEGERLKAYKCTSGVWTIGLGITTYPNGKAVKEGDIITKEQSTQYFYLLAEKFGTDVNNTIKVDLSQNRWDVLFSIAWNYGMGWFSDSKLIVKQVNINQNNLVLIKDILTKKMTDNPNRRKIEYAKYIKS